MAFTFVCVGLHVTALCMFSGTEDSYTVTCGMPLPCLADSQKDNSGLYCLGKSHQLAATHNLQLGTTHTFLKIGFMCNLVFAAGQETSAVPRIKTIATFKSGTAKCNLKRSQGRLKERLNSARSGTEQACLEDIPKHKL